MAFGTRKVFGTFEKRATEQGLFGQKKPSVRHSWPMRPARRNGKPIIKLIPSIFYSPSLTALTIYSGGPGCSKAD